MSEVFENALRQAHILFECLRKPFSGSLLTLAHGPDDTIQQRNEENNISDQYCATQQSNTEKESSALHIAPA